MSESPVPPVATSSPIQFRLVHVFYVMAELGVCLALFGVGGIIVGPVVIAFWGYVFSSRSRPRALLEAVAALLVGSCLICMLLPAISVAGSAARRSQCANNLKTIALALQNYHEVYGEFPPAYVVGQDGQPMHSWRVLLLPFLEQKPLYDQYRFDEPWDGPNNRQLANKISWDVYACPRDIRSGQTPAWTSYVAVVGPRTVWPGARSRRLSEIPDGTSDTVMLVEYHGGQINWMEPRDLPVDEALRVLTSVAPEEAGPHRTEDFFFEYRSGRQVALVDGAIRFFPQPGAREVWSALLTVDDGGDSKDRNLSDPPPDVRRPKLGNWFRLAIFVLLTLLPLPWVWVHPRERSTGQPGSAQCHSL